MADYTTILSMRKPTRTLGDDDVINVELDVNDNMDAVDTNINMRLSTSSTRPSNPYTGQLIFEVDTGQVRLSDSEWEWIGSNSSPKGKMAMTTSTTDSAVLTGVSAETLYISATFTAVNGRRYWVEYGAHIEALVLVSSQARAEVSVRWAAGGSVANTDTLLGVQGLDISRTLTANSERIAGLYELTPGVDGDVTVGLFLKAPTAVTQVLFDGGTNRVNWISVRDVGV